MLKVHQIIKEAYVASLNTRIMNKLTNLCGYKSAKIIGHERPCEFYPTQDLV